MSKEHRTVTIAARRRLPLALAAALAVAAALTAAMLAGGGPAGGLGPAAALAQAAERTAEVRSGVAAITIADGLSHVAITARWDGDDAEAVVEDATGEGPRVRTFRLVDGVLFQREGDGEWTSAPWTGEATGLEAIQAEASSETLAEMARAATGVTREGDEYRAQVSPEALAGLEGSPLGVPDAAEAVAVEVAAGDDGLIRSVEVETANSRHALAYSELGQPQRIEAPAP